MKMRIKRSALLAGVYLVLAALAIPNARAQHTLYTLRRFLYAARAVFGDAQAWQDEHQARLERAKRSRASQIRTR